MTTTPGRLELAIRENDEHRWWIVATNGNHVASSTEGYRDERDMDRSLVITLEVLLADLPPAVVAETVGRWLTSIALQTPRGSEPDRLL
jgi:hypothetical protein